ncbi:MAG: RidA family protein [Vampirovibrionales bacterium]|nr:RidA family protein [Vampirovibrionales bacterium]
MSQSDIPEHPLEHIQLPSSVLPGTLGYYAHAVKAGGFIHFCGIGARNPESGKEVGVELDENNQLKAYDITLQTQQVLENLNGALDANGCSLSDLVEVTVYLRDMRDFLKYNQVYNAFFEKAQQTGQTPARTTIEASPPGQSFILIKAIAYKP